MAVDRGILKLGGVIVLGLFAGSIYLHFRNKLRDDLTSDFITELRKELNPTTQGLPGLDALDESYLPKIRKSLGSGISLIVMREADAVKYAERIKNAWGTFNDDEEAIYQTLRELKDKVQVSQVAIAYHQAYDITLIEDFQGRLDESEIKTVVDIIKTKPAYRKI